MPATYYCLLTVTGLNKLAAAQANQTPLPLTQFCVGDSNGLYYEPTGNEAALVHEVWRGDVNRVYVHATNPNWIVVEAIIPSTDGGFDIREAGVLDNTGALIAIAKYPLTTKPAPGSGSEKDLYVRMIFQVTNAGTVQQTIDGSLVMATKEYVDTSINAHATDADPHPQYATDDALGVVQTNLNAHLANTVYPLFGTGADGAVANLVDADTNASTIAQTAPVTLTHNRIIRAKGNITISQTITVGTQDGQARGNYPTTHGSPGIPLGAILAALGSKGIPAPIRPGGDNAGLCGGVVQILSGDTVNINAAINALGANAAADGGGNGGLVVVVAKNLIVGAGAINVSAADGHSTAAARGGAGGYSGEPGGHAGWGGCSGGGGANTNFGYYPGTPGAGFVPGKCGAYGTQNGPGGGGGTIDAAATGQQGAPSVTIFGGLFKVFNVAGGNGATSTTNATAGIGPGSGGGGGACYSGDAHNAGANGSPGGNVYTLSSLSPYAGMPGGQGGGGAGGAGAYAVLGASGSGGAGAPGISPFVAGMGNGAGGAGGNGSAYSQANSYCGGDGGNGGNGGGAAGLVLMISPNITYTGTVIGRLVKITGTEALKFINGFSVV